MSLADDCKAADYWWEKLVEDRKRKWRRLIEKAVAVGGKRPCSGARSHNSCWHCGTVSCGHVGYDSELYYCIDDLPGLFSPVSLGKRFSANGEDMDRYSDRAILLHDTYWVCSAECDAAVRLGYGWGSGE